MPEETDLWGYESCVEAADCVRTQSGMSPQIGIVLGSGLGQLTDVMTIEHEIPFSEVPHMPKATAMGHKGVFLLGTISNVPVIVMCGRLHFYEGYTLQQITFPIRLMHQLGIDLLVLTNAAGGMEPAYKPGDLMLIDDHINLMGDNPLCGFNEARWGERFPDMSHPYDAELNRHLLDIAHTNRIPIHQGVYVGVKGPNYETRAEYRFFRMIGGDAVGMSTVPETLVSIHAGCRVCGISVITNSCLPDALTETSGEEVLSVAQNASRNVRSLLKAIVDYESQRPRLFPKK